MHDIRAIRENRAAFEAALSRRPGLDAKSETDQILELDAKVRAAILEKEAAEQARNAKSKEIGKAKAAKDEALAQKLMADVAEAKATIEAAGAREAEAMIKRDDVLARLPNLPFEDVPDGKSEHDNVVQRVWDKGPQELDHRPSGLRSGAKVNKPKDHADIGAALGMMDFEAAARMSGARFVVLKGQLARLERALAAFMLDVQTGEHGYSETSVPLLVRSNAMFGTGQLPKFEMDLFKTSDALVAPAIDGGAVEASNAHSRYLIPTAEVSLTNTVREQILEAEKLPMRLTAATPCFRSEAGSAGKDTKGMIRMHQFIKVELVSITAPEESGQELERMTNCAEEILRRLNLPHRTIMLCAGDMGFGARKTYDIEVWLPSQDTYREISSCSACGDFQARRMDARFRREKGAKPEFVHTLNGSGLAVGRTLVAILENYQREDGKVDVPEALAPYMGNLKVIG